MILLVDPETEFRTAFLAAAGVEAIEIEQPDDACAAIGDGTVLVVAGPNVEARAALALAAEVQRAAPDVGVVLVRRKPSPALLRDAMRVGVRDVLDAHAPRAAVREALERALAQTERLRGRGGPAAAPPGTVTTVFSAKGGCGKSVVASNLAVLIAASTSRDVALVDLDLESGDLAVMLRLVPARSICELAANVDAIDRHTARAHCTLWRDGVSLLAAPAHPGFSEKVPPGAVRVILSALRESFHHVVVDGPATFTDHALAALDESDRCVLVTGLDVTGLKNAKVAMRTLGVIGFARERVSLVVNRAEPSLGIGVEDVERALRMKAATVVPASRDVQLSVNRGVPLALSDPSSPAVVAIARLAGGAPRQPSRLLTRLRPGRTSE